MIPDERLYEIMSKATMGVFDAHEVGITGIESGAKEYAKQVAIDFVIFVGAVKDGQIKMIKKSMNWNELFDLYLKSNK